MNFSQRHQRLPASIAKIRKLHRIIQSVGATGGVYKGQGRNQCELMTRTYWEFQVHVNSFSPQSQARRWFSGLPGPLGLGNTR